MRPQGAGRRVAARCPPGIPAQPMNPAAQPARRCRPLPLRPPPARNPRAWTRSRNGSNRFCRRPRACGWRTFPRCGQRAKAVAAGGRRSRRSGRQHKPLRTHPARLHQAVRARTVRPPRDRARDARAAAGGATIEQAGRIIAARHAVEASPAAEPPASPSVIGGASATTVACSTAPERLFPSDKLRGRLAIASVKIYVSTNVTAYGFIDVPASPG